MIISEIDFYMKFKSKQSDITVISKNLPKLIYYLDNLIDLRRFYISTNCVQDVCKIAYNENHFDFTRCFEIIFKAWYVKNLIKQFKAYIKHCFKRFVFQTRRHNSYDNFQFIDFFSMSFHTVPLDFILVLSLSIEQWNTIMSITNKFIKRIILRSKKAHIKRKIEFYFCWSDLIQLIENILKL